jgi:coenzyme Q-binding protein COQ10
MRIAALDNLAVKLKHEAQHAMGRWVLWPEIYGEVTKPTLNHETVSRQCQLIFNVNIEVIRTSILNLEQRIPPICHASFTTQRIRLSFPAEVFGAELTIGLTRRLAVLSESVGRWLPYTPEQLFDLAAHVERYPEFLPWWIAARIRKRHANVYYTDQILGLGPIRVRFASKTVLDRPRRIDVSSDEPPFRRFSLSWLFEPRPNAGCRVRLSAQLELRSRVLQTIMEQVLPRTIGDIIVAFEARARQLYEAPGRANANAPSTPHQTS